MPISARLMVLGGGGYNPWSVGRCWTGVWATLSGHSCPDVLPDAAQKLLQNLSWSGQSRIKVPPQSWTETLRDPYRPGSPSPVSRDRLAKLASRSRVWV